MDIREFFKKFVTEAKLVDRSQCTLPIAGCSHRQEWFTKYGKHKGPYWELTDDYIDQMPIGLLQEKMILFIADCFRSR